MSNGSSTPSPDPAAPSPVPAPAPPPRRMGRVKRFFLWWIAGVVAALAIWTVAALNWSYAEGDRGGLLQNFARQGWLCKTYEGELTLNAAPGMLPETWRFTVRDKAVAERLAGLVGERVQLHYVEHRGLPSGCFGETSYFVDRVAPAPAPAPTSDASAPPATPSPP